DDQPGAWPRTSGDHQGLPWTIADRALLRCRARAASSGFCRVLTLSTRRAGLQEVLQDGDALVRASASLGRAQGGGAMPSPSGARGFALPLAIVEIASVKSPARGRAQFAALRQDR